MAPASMKEGGKKTIEATAFQIECESESQWKKLLKKEGLIVVDVYSSWAGPCLGMVNILKRIKVDINDDRLWYAVAQTDNIAQLHMFHDQSEPTWLFIGGGKPVKVFRGTHVPKLTSLIKSEFQHELLCLAGKAKRNMISIDDEVSRRRKAEAEAQSLMKFMKDEDQTAEGMISVRKESSVRLMRTLEPYTVLVVQNYLLETGALTEIRDELYGEFKIEEERTVNLDEKGVRELFRIPYALPDPNQPIEELLAPDPLPGNEDSNPDIAVDEVKPIVKPIVKTIPVAIPPGLIGDTHIMLLEAIDLAKMLVQGKKPSATSPLQTADDYLQIKVGPLSYQDALEHAPESLHAVYGKGEYVPGVWCPRRYDDKRYVVINFFPRFVTEMLTPAPFAGTPKYMVAIFHAAKAPAVKLGMELHRQDILASGTMKLQPDVVHGMLESWDLSKDSDAYKTKMELISGDVFAVSVNRNNSSLGLAIKSLDPIHISHDNTAGTMESGKLFSQLNIKLDEIPNPEAVVSKFLARSQKRPTSVTALALAMPRPSQMLSRTPSGSELPDEENDEETEPQGKEKIEEPKGITSPDVPAPASVAEASEDIEESTPKEEPMVEPEEEADEDPENEEPVENTENEEGEE